MKKIINFIKKNMLGILVFISLGLNMVVLANNMILSEQVSYINSKTNETTVDGALDELFSAVDINNKLGNIDQISDIGDGTVSGAISTLNTKTIDPTWINVSRHVHKLSRNDRMFSFSAIYQTSIEISNGAKIGTMPVDYYDTKNAIYIPCVVADSTGIHFIGFGYVVLDTIGNILYYGSVAVPINGYIFFSGSYSI